MSDLHAPLPPNAFKGKAAMPKPTKPSLSDLCQGKILPNGWCETTANAVRKDRDVQLSLKVQDDPVKKAWMDRELEKKDRVIQELRFRLKSWNEINCWNCNTPLKDLGPKLLTTRDVEYFEDPELFNERAAQGKMDNNSEAAASLRKILDRK